MNAFWDDLISLIFSNFAACFEDLNQFEPSLYKQKKAVIHEVSNCIANLPILAAQ